MGLFFDENRKIEEDKDILDWYTIESFILEYNAITKCIITTKCGLPIISQNTEEDELFSSKYVEYIASMQLDFNDKLNFMTVSAEKRCTIIFKKFDLIFILDYVSGSEEMVKRRLMNAFSTYESFFLSYSKYI